MRNKTVLVTGASSGMGWDFAKALAEQGFKVYAAARRLEKMEGLKAYGVIPIKMDISKEEDIQACVAQITAANGGIDILINNAGFGMYGAVEDTPVDKARYQFEVNLFGLATLTQSVLPYMREKGAGKIINVTSIGGKIYAPLGAWYHATKHALEGWSDCLRVEVQSFGIDVVIIEPGAIATEFNAVMADNLYAHSLNGPYQSIAEKLDNAQKQAAGIASPPSVITKLVCKAINAKKPKTRYAAGKYAGMLLFFRHYLSDRAFDRLIMSMVR